MLATEFQEHNPAPRRSRHDPEKTNGWETTQKQNAGRKKQNAGRKNKMSGGNADKMNC
jgi:hypothetical protein